MKSYEIYRNTMIRRIKDILKDAGLIKPDGYMIYHTEENGIMKTSKMFVEADWGIEDYGNCETSPLYHGGVIGICRCITPYGMQIKGILEEEKKRVYLSVLQGILASHKYPKEDRVHLWTEEREGFTYVYGAIEI